MKRKTVEQRADEWVDLHFPDFEDRDIYTICFIAGFRAARPLRSRSRSVDVQQFPRRRKAGS